ncbi:hypothetical protein CAPTEDRAFT_188082 [Capitella teleta]|uniref:Uncharacterized protein n=1 Tax=Capitella teleta TaxID=283909 RepID=R7UFB9_CAPTE|nr:hypothetical protein CAPTEDRAFT_188082 [Capitella teleta]|eukprot:ELU04915.1 hypothetical protein CAPTEDRAFT_188082 [Capitella teleta]
MSTFTRRETADHKEVGFSGIKEKTRNKEKERDPIKVISNHPHFSFCWRNQPCNRNRKLRGLTLQGKGDPFELQGDILPSILQYAYYRTRILSKGPLCLSVFTLSVCDLDIKKFRLLPADELSEVFHSESSTIALKVCMM